LNFRFFRLFEHKSPGLGTLMFFLFFSIFRLFVFFVFQLFAQKKESFDHFDFAFMTWQFKTVSKFLTLQTFRLEKSSKCSTWCFPSLFNCWFFVFSH
jgi:hypothetical protein